MTDGDTIKVRCGEGAQTTIRLAGIDAPEKKQAFGQRSKQALSDLCYQVQANITPKRKTATAAPWLMWSAAGVTLAQSR